MYLLDTNVLSELMRLKPNPHVEVRFESEPAPLLTSVICLEEIRYGAKIAPPGNKLWERFAADLRPHLTTLPLDESVAILAGDMRSEWKTRGTPIGYRDGLIAATAHANNLVLVTRNVRHFDHIVGLKIENWFEPPTPSVGGSAVTT
jgi:predicted nucleic acid-binding protein